MTSRWRNALTDEFEIKNAEKNTLITNFLLFSALPSAPMSLWPLWVIHLTVFPEVLLVLISSFCPVLHIFLFWFVLLFLFWFLVLPCMRCCHEFRNSVISFFSSYKSLPLFFLSDYSPPPCPQTSVSMPLRDLLLLGRSWSCVLYFILSFSSSPYCTWKGSGT